MNEKELREIRRRFKPERSAMGKIYGCYVDERGSIAAAFEESVPTMADDEAERFLALMKKAVSGTLGKNLMGLEFSAKQVMDGAEHKLLMQLRESGAKDGGARKAFFERATESLNIEGAYVILLAADAYDVPFRTADGSAQEDASDEMFTYIVCAVCPVRQSTPGLSFIGGENHIRTTSRGLVVAAPELGFMFPSFDDRAANIYGALYHTRSTAENYAGFVGAIFGVEPPMPAVEQREAFQDILAKTIDDDLSLGVVQSVHEQLSGLIDLHKESKDPEQLVITRRELGMALKESGVSDERVEAFGTSFDERFGEDAEVPPGNIIDKKQFVISTPEAVIKVDPEQSARVETRVIDGVEYILIPADAGVEVNGVSVRI